MSFQASEVEFRQRFWFIAAIFAIGFFLYNFDRTNLAIALARLSLGGHPNEDSAIFDHYARGFFALGALFTILAAFIRSWAEAYLHSSIVHDMAIHGEQLVADGPFRRVRNPLYLGNMLLVVGVGFLASRVGAAFLIIAMFLFVYRLILREETTLLESQGESYRRYYDAVPRLIPSVLPRVPASGAKPNWADGLTGEVSLWGVAAGMVVFVITERILYFWIVFGAGFVIYFLQSFIRSRRAKSAAG